MDNHDAFDNYKDATDIPRWLMLVMGAVGAAGLTYIRDDHQKKAFVCFSTQLFYSH